MKQTKFIPLIGLGLTLFLSKPHSLYGNTSFGGGSGTENDPYLLSTPEHLTELQVAVDGGNTFSEKYFILTNDIDFTGYDNDSNPDNGNFEPIGYTGETSGYFSGSFDGNNHSILNLQILSPNLKGIGFFANLQKANINNLFLKNLKIEGDTGVGGVVATSIQSTISNCSVSGEVVSTSEEGGAIGGLVGGDIYSSIDTSSFSGTISGSQIIGGLSGQSVMSTVKNSSVSGTVSGDSTVGGLIGQAMMSTVENSSASGTVLGNESIGGLFGASMMINLTQSFSLANVKGSDCIGGLSGNDYGSKILETFSQGDVFGNNNIGGLIGHANQSTEISESYSSSDIKGNSHIGGLVGLIENNTSSDGSLVLKNSYYDGMIEGVQFEGTLVGCLSGDFDSEANVWYEGSISFDNIYYNKEKNSDYPLIGEITHGTVIKENVIPLNSFQMTQSNAKNYMSSLDFDSIWTITSTTPMFKWQKDLMGATEGDVQINGEVQTMVADVTIPSVSPDLVINPNLSEGYVAPEFTIKNHSVSPIKLELKTFEQTTNAFNDVLPTKYDSWEGLNKAQSQNIALGLVAKEGEGWQSLTTETSYVAGHIEHEIGVIKPASTVGFSFDVKHGTAFSEATTVQYKMIFVFDLLN